MFIPEIVKAASDIDSMGDKVAAFVIAQNLFWVSASLKSELGDWIKDRRCYFIGSAIIAGVLYACVEWYLSWHADQLIGLSGYDNKILPVIIGASELQFSMRGLGAFISSVLAAFAFWGTSRPERQNISAVASE